MAKDNDAQKEKEKAPEGNETEADPGKKKKKLILFAGGGTLLVALLGGAFFFLRSKPSEPAHTEETGASEHGEEAATKEAEPVTEENPEKKEEHEKSAEPEKKEEHEAKNEGAQKSEPGKEEKKEATTPAAEKSNIEIGESFRFDTFHINLGNPLDNRYIRMNISIEYRNGAGQKSEIEKRKDQLRDVVISVTGKKTREFLLSPDGKDQLRLELLKSINRYMKQPIEAVYITDFLIE